MINQSAVTVQFRLNNGRQISGKNAIIYIRVRQGRSVDFKNSLGWKISSDHWNKITQRVKNRSSIHDRDEINNQLNELQAYILKECSILKSSGIAFSNEKAKSIFKSFFESPQVPQDLFGFIDEFIHNAKNQIHHGTGKPVSSQTIRSYETSKNFLKRFHNEVYKINFEKITLDFYYDFVEFGNKNDLSMNYIGKHIKTLKTFLNEALEQNLTTNKQFQSSKFKVLKEESDNIYLTLDELNKIASLNLTDKPNLDRARDLFLIGSYTGLRVSDYNNLKKENISIHGETLILNVKTQKTGAVVKIPLHPIVSNILQKYNGNPPKKMPEQHINKFIKLVGEQAKINATEHVTQTIGGKEITKAFKRYELIKTHTARRSFCTNAHLSGMQSIDIMAISGHKTESAFLKYIKVTKEQTALRIAKHGFFSEQNFLKAV